MMDNNSKEKRFYGRRQGRPLNKSRQDAMDALLPILSIPPALLTENGDLNPQDLFDSHHSQMWFEIGFGTGEHLSALMRRYPDYGFLGAEPFENGMAAFLKDVLVDFSVQPSLHGSSVQSSSGEMDCTNKSCNDGKRNCNVRVFMDDAMFIANSLADHSLDGMYVLNPDPWHKKRHYKRRIISQENLDCFARILKPGAQLIMSTDVPDLADWMVTQASVHPAFEWSARQKDDWSMPPDDWVHTAYETKKAKNADKMVYLFFRRK